MLKNVAYHGVKCSGAPSNQGMKIKCAECRTEFNITPTYYRRGIRRCSNECAFKARKGRPKSEAHKRAIARAHIGLTKVWSGEARKQCGLRKLGVNPHRNKTPEQLAII